VAAAAYGAAFFVVSSQLGAQNDRDRDRGGRRSIDLGAGGVGLSIGDSRRWTGLRLNYRDSRLIEANGINVTLWNPYSGGAGRVNGFAIGLPATGATELTGVGLGVFGFAAERRFTGIGIGGVGMGGGGDMSGIMLAGVGMGSGGDISGIAIAGVGMGGGGNLRGIAIGGLGAGMGGSMTGISIGGLGVGSGGDITGLVIGGLGAGFGGTLKGIGIGGLGIGGSRIRGIAIAGAGVGGQDIKGGILTPGIFRVERGGRFQGVAVAGYSQNRGRQDGWTIGVVNYARDLRGVQIGLINIAKSNPKGTRVLPLFNANFAR
jgi:hypothetical protein